MGTFSAGSYETNLFDSRLHGCKMYSNLFNKQVAFKIIKSLQVFERNLDLLYLS